MSSAYWLIPLGLVLMGGALAALFWAIDSGQFDDLECAGRAALEDDAAPEAEPPSGSGGDRARPGGTPRASST